MGTDHGYLPIHFALQGSAAKLYASDVAAAPLEAARRNAERYGVAERIEFLLTDGIDATLAPSLDCVIIAGMGGETIVEILDRAAAHLRSGTQFVLQPQTKIPTLLDFLAANGYAEPHLTEVSEGRRKYTIITTERA